MIGLLAWAAMCFIVFTIAELRTEEPLIPMSLFRNRIFAVAMLVTLISGVAMMGSFFYIPLFMQGVIGASATNSGFVLIPMMISMAIASAVSGQFMSRLGRYRIRGSWDWRSWSWEPSSLAAGCELDAERRDVRDDCVWHRAWDFDAAVYAGGQNAVPYRLMGVSTSTMQFLRSVGGTFGVAMMFSLIQSGYHTRLATAIPPEARDNPGIREALDDPLFIQNPQAFEGVRGAFSSFGEQGESLFAQSIQGVKESLAVGIADAFLVSVFILIVALAISVFMQEIPLRKAHYSPEEQDFPGSTPEADLALAPVAGGANGHAGDVDEAAPRAAPGLPECPRQAPFVPTLALTLLAAARAAATATTS